MSSPDRIRWNEAFGRSTFGMATWTDRNDLGDLRGAPAGSWTAMYSGSRPWRVYADGGWDRYDNYTFSDANERGACIYGWATLRFLCAINGITPPGRRLKGEPFVPSSEILVRAVWEQLANQHPANDPTSKPCVFSESNGGHSIDALSEPAREFWRYLKALHEESTEGGSR